MHDAASPFWWAQKRGTFRISELPLDSASSALLRATLPFDLTLLEYPFFAVLLRLNAQLLQVALARQIGGKVAWPQVAVRRTASNARRMPACTAK